MSTKAPVKKKRRIKQPHEVVYLDGSKVNWRKPPAANRIMKWTKRDVYGREIRGTFRTLCHMNRLNNLAIKKFNREINVIQRDWNTGVAASAGTHDFDSTFDLWIDGVDPWEQQRFFRRNGLGGWMRSPAQGFSWHYHGFTLPPREGSSISDDFKVAGIKVGIYVDGGYSTRGYLATSSQIADYYNEAFGLSGRHTPHSDRTWFPSNKEATIFNLKKYVERRADLAA